MLSYREETFNIIDEELDESLKKSAVFGKKGVYLHPINSIIITNH